MKLLSVFLFGAILWASALSVARADNPASISDMTISALNSPVSYGTTLQATASATATPPVDTVSELTITNTIWLWTATGDTNSVCIETNSENSTDWYWTNAPGGDNTVTITASVTYKCTNMYGPTNISVSCSNTFTVTVIQLTNQCVSTTPSDQTRTTIGVGEQVSLWLVGSPSGTFSWGTSAGSLLYTFGTTNVFTAPDTASTPTVTVYYNSGSSSRVPFNVLEPTSELAVIYQSNLLSYPSGQPLPAGIQGASMELYPITVYPTNVSFYNVECQEQYCAATGIWGYFTNRAGPHARQDWVQLLADNTWADEAGCTNYPAPWSQGGYQWIIPVKWRVVVGSTHTGSLPNRTETFSIDDTNGTTTVSKLVQSVTR